MVLNSILFEFIYIIIILISKRYIDRRYIL